MQLRITVPMTVPLGGASISCMEKARQRNTTPAEFRKAMAERIKKARDGEGFSYAGIADRLSARIGRDISADTYRKWETIDSSMPLDVILAFCDLTKVHPNALLSIDAPAALSEPHGRRQRMTEAQADRLLSQRRR